MVNKSKEFEWVLADDRRIRGITWGQGPRHILALHGWLDNVMSFAPLAACLSKDISFHAIDLSGHGRSDHRPRGTYYHMTDWLWDVELILEHVPKPLDTLLGHSLGGAIASMYAGVRPSQVPQLFAIEAFGPLSEESQDFSARIERHLTERRSFLKRKTKPYPDFDAVLSARLKATPMPEAGARAILERSLQQGAAGWSWTSDPMLTVLSPVRLTEEQVRSTLSRIRCPTQLVIANEARYGGEAHMADRISLVPSLQLHRLNGGHHLHMEHPEAIAKLI